MMKLHHSSTDAFALSCCQGEECASTPQLRARLLSPLQDEMQECFRLRHAHFVQEKGWVSENPSHPGLEWDGYDAHAFHLAVFDTQGVAAYLRALPFVSSVGFMLDHDLSAVLSEEQRRALVRDKALELSRLVVRRDLLLGWSNAEPHPVEYLVRQLYHLSLERGFTSYYIVVEAGWLTPFRRRFGLPFHRMGEPYTFLDGTVTVAAETRLQDVEAAVARHSQEKFRWYQKGPDCDIPVCDPSVKV